MPEFANQLPLIMSNTKPRHNPDAFFQLLRHPVKYRLFLLKKLPAAYFSGLKIPEVSQERCVVTVPFKWFTQNPFRSTYFACLSMAAEMSTGVLAMAQVFGRKPAVSMLVVSVEGKFFKKAVGITRFVCEEGRSVQTAVQDAIDTGAGQTICLSSKGFNLQGELVAEFIVTWSFKAKTN
jgi:hypothetical protein